MRGWLAGTIPVPGLPASPPQIAGTDQTGSAPTLGSDTTPVETSPTPAEVASPTPTPTLVSPPAEISPDVASSFAGAEPVPGGWKWAFPTVFEQGPISLDDGGLYFITKDHTVYALNADGSPRLQRKIEDIYPLRNSFTGFLPMEIFGDGTTLVKTEERLYAIGPDGSERWSFPVSIPRLPSDAFDPPVPSLIHAGEVYLQLDATNTLHVFSLQNGLLWKTTFDKPLREYLLSLPIVDEANGQVVFIDEPGHVRAFDLQDGTLRWEYQPEEGLRGASDLAQGPDRTLYFVITNLTIGMLQALSPEGEPLWRTELDTFNFYNIPVVNPKGDLVFVDEDLVEAATGRLLDVEFPFEVDEFIMGEDGEMYLRTEGSLIHWQVGAGGFETLNTAPLRLAENTSFFSPYFFRVREGGIIEIRDFSQNQFALRWMTLDGESLGAHTGPTLYFPDEAVYYPCTTRQEDSESFLDCEKFVAGNPEPVWTGSFGPFEAEITLEDAFFYRNGKLFVIDSMTLYVTDAQVP